MIIAQISDLHIGFERDNPDESNWRRLQAVIRHLCDGPNRPDMLLATGDLADKGNEESYRRCAALFAQCPFPVHSMVGNHDNRANFGVVFPTTGSDDGFAHYCVEAGGMRIILLDTLESGRHRAGFCAARAQWLGARLAEDRLTPTVIVMHHPPLDVGIAWLTTMNDEPWVRRFSDMIEGHTQIQAIWCGHMHRPITAQWRGITVAVCPATAAQLALDVRPIDPEVADGRAMLTADAPGYALHLWRDGQLVTLFDTVQHRVTVASFDDRMQPLVRHLAEERRTAQ